MTYLHDNLQRSRSGEGEGLAPAESTLNSSASALGEGVYIALHGHFYQPPRENPYLGKIERQSAAAPFQNWNERIHHECYRTNAFARILNDAGEVVEIINNFEYLSFNIGPTLMSWLAQYDDETYQRILEADRNSCDRLNGHGNAIAQVYNHIIMPLANEQDKITQVRWGKADFAARFGRDPEGMWLAEAAVDYPTLEVLIAEGIRFIIVAPSQVARCRPLALAAEPESSSVSWLEVGGGQIDPTRPYRCYLPHGDRQRDYIDVFVYDGPISRDMGFNDILKSSTHFANRLGLAVRSDRQGAQLISVATDGETFGHHKRDTERAIAYAVRHTFPNRGWTVTNFGHYLSLHPPTWEVELKSVTAWSCAHGVDRWQDDCGCGGEGSLWHQKWRRPLRNALDWLRDQLREIYVEQGSTLLLDPWQARNAYIEVLLKSTPTDPESGLSDPIDAFFLRQQHHELSAAEQVDALRLLEMQRHALLMYTSCGWFFEELSRPEGLQILRYAARAIALAGEVAGVSLEPEFMERLALAPSNLEQFQNGAGIYRQQVQPSQMSPFQIAAHYGMNSLFQHYPAQTQLYGYQIQQLDYERQQIGTLNLALGQLQLQSQVTRESNHVVIAVLHLGGLDFHCGVQPFLGRRQYAELKQTLFNQLQGVSAARLVLTMSQWFGDQQYGIQDLCPDNRQELLTLLSQTTLLRLNQLYTQVYRDNYSLIMAYRRDDLDVPEELLTATQISLSHRAAQAVAGLTRELTSLLEPESAGQAHLVELEAIALEAQQLNVMLNLPQVTDALNPLLEQWLAQLLYQNGLQGSGPSLGLFARLLQVAQTLHLPLHLNRLQEQLLTYLQVQFANHLPHIAYATHLALNEYQAQTGDTLPNQAATATLFEWRPLIKLGQVLAVDMRPWTTALMQSSTNLEG